LDAVSIKTKPGIAVSVVLASEGYPGSYPKGREIIFPPNYAASSKAAIFHAGTKWEKDTVVTAGGRVLAVTAYGDTLQEALKEAYDLVDQTKFEGKTYRRDIAHRYDCNNIHQKFDDF
jgi:phosphoribosylamine--glycine ligase/phosphoribosylformylglycinamidine cyclo-ligase